MDTAVLVENQINDGQTLLMQLVGRGFDVTAACWVNVYEEGWYLYIVSKEVNETGRPSAKGEALGVVLSMDSPWFTLFNVKVVGTSDPIAHDLEQIRQLSRGRAMIWKHRFPSGKLSVEEAYIYAPVRRREAIAFTGEKRKLKSAVQQRIPVKEYMTPLQPLERTTLLQLVSLGIDPAEAEYWVRKRRDAEPDRTAIPAGTVVKTQVAGWWGEKPEDDPNPLLLVESETGAQGLTFKDNTEPG